MIRDISSRCRSWWCRVAVLALLAFSAVMLALHPFGYLLVVIHLGALSATAYPLVYRRAGWQRGRTGKALMNMARSLALLFDVAILGYWWPFPGYDYIYAIVVTYLCVAITYQLTVMLELKSQMLAAERQASKAAHPSNHNSEGALP